MYNTRENGESNPGTTRENGKLNLGLCSRKVNIVPNCTNYATVKKEVTFEKLKFCLILLI